MKPSEIPTYFKYWGKANKTANDYHLLPYHCLDVAAVGHSLLSENAVLRDKITSIIGFDKNICIRLVILFLAFHDIGKFSETFQNLRSDLLHKLQSISSRKQYIVRHDSLGNLFLKSSFETEALIFPAGSGISFDEWQDVIMAIVRAYTGHHGMQPQMK